MKTRWNWQTARSWALRLAVEDASAVAALRLRTGVEVGTTERFIWLRGPIADESLTRALRRLPAVARYEWFPDGRLRPLESRIPSERLPLVQWQSLRDWIRLEMPVAGMPRWEPHPVSLCLAPAEEEWSSDLILTGLDEWIEFGQKAALVRLEKLRFAVNDRRQALIAGRPLPPISGEHFVLRGRIAVPAGLMWQPAVAPEVLERRWRVGTEAVVLWHRDGTLSRLDGEQFVPATRSALSELSRLER